MTDEQIKVLEDQLKVMVELNTFSGRKPLPALTKFTDALTAALDFIRDMREPWVAAVEVMFNDGRGMSRNLVNARWFVWGLGSKTPYHESLYEAFKAVKGGKD